MIEAFCFAAQSTRPVCSEIGDVDSNDRVDLPIQQEVGVYGGWETQAMGRT